MTTGRDPDGTVDARRVAIACDRDEITQVMYRYATAVQNQDLELLLSCFTSDAVLDYGDFAQLEGEAAIREMFGASMERRRAGAPMFSLDEAVVSTPIMTNVMVEVDGDQAHSEHTCIAIHAGRVGDGGRLLLHGTRNIDELERTPDGWRIRNRRHETAWGTELEADVP
jgi:ketosteroid isomerase-like protein